MQTSTKPPRQGFLWEGTSLPFIYLYSSPIALLHEIWPFDAVCKQFYLFLMNASEEVTLTDQSCVVLQTNYAHQGTEMFKCNQGKRVYTGKPFLSSDNLYRVCAIFKQYMVTSLFRGFCCFRRIYIFTFNLIQMFSVCNGLAVNEQTHI